MKKIFKFAAIAAATFSLSSCADFIDALMNNYFVDGQCVIIGSAEVKTTGPFCGFVFLDKQEGSKEQMAILMSEEQFAKACADSLSTENLTVSASANNGETSIVALSSSYVAFVDQDPRKDKYDGKPVKYYGKIKFDDLGDGRYKVGGKVKFSLKKKDSSEVDDFEMTVRYNGVPKLDN